jgi:hypothetical protein
MTCEEAREPHPHLIERRRRIDARLRELSTRHAELQAAGYPWLYGALGEVPSRVVFICENPSLAGVRKAHGDTVDGGPPDIEAQWWGGRKDAAARRFRVALWRTGLKTSPPTARGGWRCTITNVVKEANVARAEQDGQSRGGRDEQARAWADVLRWELERVRPAHIFCVGQDAHRAVRGLQRAGHLPPFPTRYVCHDPARGADEPISARFIGVVQATLGDAQPARAARQRPEPATSPPALPGSRSPLAGKRIVRAPAYQAGGNPRRPGSHGYNAYELIPPGDRGIRVEERGNTVLIDD